MAKRIGKSLLARRYATALFELAQKHKAENTVQEELAAFADALATSPALAAAANNPALPRSKVVTAIEKILASAKASALTGQFITLLTENGRLALLPEVLNAYNTLLAEASGTIAVEVTSAADLTAQQESRLKQAIEAATKRSVSLTRKTNPALIGGLTIRVGSQLLDASVAGKLERLQLHLKSAANT